MDQYQALAAKLKRLANEVVGMRREEAISYLKAQDLKVRILSVDGQAMMVTADNQPDRIGLDILKDKVLGTRLG